MWVNIKIVSLNKAKVFFPSSIKIDFSKSKILEFGRNSLSVKIAKIRPLNNNDGSTADKPITIVISRCVKDTLLIHESINYQLKIEDGIIILGPAIGFLLGSHTDIYDPNHMQKYSDRFGIYNKIGGLIYAFSIKNIDWKNKIIYGLFFNNEKKEWEYGIFPFPSVIYRRNFHMSNDDIKKIMDEGIHIFNSFRFTKYELFEILKINQELSKNLPDTQICDCVNVVVNILSKCDKIILKPTDLSRGRGICIIEKVKDSYKLVDYRPKVPIEMKFDQLENLKDFFKLNQDFFINYLVQEYIDLADVNNCLFDIRVVMQKLNCNEWVCSGIECRVAANGIQVTNISRGGYALTIDSALSQAFPDCDVDKLTKEVIELSNKFCIVMDRTEESFGEFGLDLAFDKNQKLWIIEANVFPSFKGFKKTDYFTYLNIRYVPLIYALSLTEFGSSV